MFNLDFVAKILITGGTGSIGKHLTSRLTMQGHNVVILSRNVFKQSTVEVYQWDPDKGYADEKAFEGIDHIVNLAGAGIGEKRWTKKRKVELLNSRTNAAKVLFYYINSLKLKPVSFIGASAIGYYGAQTSQKIFVESDEPAKDFLGTVCALWENSYEPIKAAAVSTSILRISPVLAKNSGVYKALAPPTAYGLGTIVGSGKQYMPWIHIDDMVSIIVELIDGTIPHGVYNAVAPEHVNGTQFMNALAASLGRKIILPRVPAIVLKLGLGEMSSMIVEGSRISAQKLLQNSFKFKHETIESALSNLAKSNK